MNPTPDWNTLVDVPRLAVAAAGLQLADARAHTGTALRIMDARAALGDPHAGAQAYAQGHLAGALHADLDQDLADLSRPRLGRHPLPESAAFAHALAGWGITAQTQVVAYDAGDGSMAAARLWWLLRLIGHVRVAVLDGGLAAWRAAGLPVTDAVPEIAPQPSYPANFDPVQVADADEVLARLGEVSGWLLDARAAERFRGEVEPIDARAGHVPGAVNRPFASNLRDGHFLPADELKAALQPLLGGHAPSQAVVMCGSGVTACHLLLALEHAGLHGARVYAGSWSGWIGDSSRPVATG